MLKLEFVSHTKLSSFELACKPVWISSIDIRAERQDQNTKSCATATFLLSLNVVDQAATLLPMQ